MSRVALANRLTTWDFHVTLPPASVQAATLLRQCLSEPSSLLQAYAMH